MGPCRNPQEKLWPLNAQLWGGQGGSSGRLLLVKGVCVKQEEVDRTQHQTSAYTLLHFIFLQVW